ncbi:hypothetical protein FHG71_01920 [Rubellimicrobium roseum]|uniref:Uncharacterized protein n=1 Tax=Rubellimicrobium roseum TaxID=687525 RepID=A0A5C4NNJ1_9RHOB|nr:hypothetical protein FHG71_01920 [Rubellimicrobium roseum]
MQDLSSGLVVPALVLAILGWLVPRLLARIWREGVGPLLLLAFVSTLLLLALAAGVFVTLYLWQGAPLMLLFEHGTAATLGHFMRLGLLSALLWGPIMVLSLAGLPRHWKEETW